MPYRFDPRSGRFIDGRNRFVPFAAVRAEVDAVTAAAMAEAEDLADRLAAGSLDTEQFSRQMRAIIKRSHLAAAMIGSGGRASFGTSANGRAAAEIRRQYAYLEQRIRAVESGEQPLDGTFRARIAMYASAAVPTYEAVRQGLMTDAGYQQYRARLGSEQPCETCIERAALGWQPIGTLRPIGDTICLSNDRCSFEYRAKSRP